MPGNHEFYGNGDVLAYGDSWSREILPNMHYHQNKVVRIDNVDFILSTLWSHIRPEDEFVVEQGMYDFRQILYNGRRFTPADFNAEHEKCLDFIKRSVAESTAEHIVVVTHHLPTMAVVAPEHKGNLLNSAFATEPSLRNCRMANSTTLKRYLIIYLSRQSHSVNVIIARESSPIKSWWLIL